MTDSHSGVGEGGVPRVSERNQKVTLVEVYMSPEVSRSNFYPNPASDWSPVSGPI